MLLFFSNQSTMFVSFSEEVEAGADNVKTPFLLNEIDNIPLNTSILTLFSASEFVNYLVCKTSEESLISVLSNIYIKLNGKNHLGISTSIAIDEFNKNLPKFKIFNQNNVIDVMDNLLVLLHDKLSEKNGNFTSPRGNLIQKTSKEVWEDYLKKHDSIISNLFHIQFQVNESCPTCKSNFISFFHLANIQLTHLDVFESSSLNEKIQMYLDKFPLRSNHRCPKCSIVVNENRIVKISKLPNYLFFFHHSDKIVTIDPLNT
jgi:ubiquitin C-terminal hydrolase